MVLVKPIEVLPSHELFAVERASCQRMIVDDVGDEAPLVWEEAVIPLDEGELLWGEAGLVWLWMI